MKKFTDTYVQNLRPQDKPYEMKDAKFQALLVRVQPSGRKTYYCLLERGKRKKIENAAVLSVEDARVKANDLLTDFRRGQGEFGEKKKEAPTLVIFLKNSYLPWFHQTYKTGKANEKRLLSAAFKAFHDKPLNEITLEGVECWRVERREKYENKPATINRDIAIFKAVFSRAVDWEVIEKNPLAKITKYRMDNSKAVPYLTEEQEQALMGALDAREDAIRQDRINANLWRQERSYPLYPDLTKIEFVDHLKPMVILSLNTGMRRGELFNLKWADLNFDQNIITIQGATAKNSTTRHIPMIAEVLEALEGWKAAQSALSSYVFPSKDGKKFDNVNKSWRKIREQAKLDWFRWHDMRHHFASHLAMKGVDLNIIRELLGHSSYTMTLRYSHLSPSNRASAINLLSKKQN